MKQPLLIFFGFFYFIPAIFSHMYPEFMLDIYKGRIHFISLLYAIIFFILTYYFTKLKVNIPSIKQIKYLRFFFNSKVEWFFILSFIISSIVFYFVFGFQFRQTGDNISVGGSILYLNYATKAYVKCFLFKQIILISDKDYKLPFLKLILVFIGSILATSAALDALVPLIVLVFIFRRGVIYGDSGKSIFFYIIVLLVIITVPLIGLANKIGFEDTYYLFTDNFEYSSKSIIRRIATWYHSINIYIDILYNEIIPNSMDLIFNIIDTLFNRISILFGGFRDIPEIQSAARFNFLEL